ncbi:MAG: alpha/beta fold hydrolase [Planctomycetota bacterium]
MSISFANGCEQHTTTDGREFRFYELGSGETPILLLHGLFGSPSNWLSIMQELVDRYHFYALQLPIEFGQKRRHTGFKSLRQLTHHVAEFLDELGLDHAVVCGNSLGGQLALDLYAHHPERVERLILSGSAGLFERNLAGGRPPRLCRDYIRKQAGEIFYDSKHVSDKLVDDVYLMLSDRHYRRFLLKVAKATRNRYMLEELANVAVPTMIIWGSDDSITPPAVAQQFREHIPEAELCFIDQCGHAPPIEQPEKFAHLLDEFLGDMNSRRNSVPCKPR